MDIWDGAAYGHLTRHRSKYLSNQSKTAGPNVGSEEAWTIRWANLGSSTQLELKWIKAHNNYKSNEISD